MGMGVSVTYWVLFLNRPGGHTPRPILTQNGSNDVDSRKDMPFGLKISTIPFRPAPSHPERLKFDKFFDSENFRSISRLTLGSQEQTPLLFAPTSEPNKSVIVNRQCGGGKFKYVPKFYIGAQVT